MQYVWKACGWYGSDNVDTFEVPIWSFNGSGGTGNTGIENNGLTDNEIELNNLEDLCSEQISPHLREYINEELFIEFHCSNESKNEIINNLIAVLCQDYAKVTFEEFERSLEAFSHTIYNSLVHECPCIFEFAKKIAQQGEENFLCQVLESVNNSPNYNQKFKVYDNYGSTAPLGQQAQQFYNVIQINNSSQWTGTMYIPNSSCIGEHPIYSDEETMLIFMHEMMHGYYRQMILDNNFNYPNEPSNFIIENEEGQLVLNSQYWEFIIKSYWDIDPVSDNDHVIFFQAYKSFIMTSLWEMNLHFGNPSDYEYYADVMINSKDLSTSDWSVLLGLQNYETEILPNLLIKKETIDFSISNCN